MAAPVVRGLGLRVLRVSFGVSGWGFRVWMGFRVWGACWQGPTAWGFGPWVHAGFLMLCFWNMW